MNTHELADLIGRRIARYPKNWTKRTAKRFHDLAVKSALGEITEIQEEELEYLQKLRRES